MFLIFSNPCLKPTRSKRAGEGGKGRGREHLQTTISRGETSALLGYREQDSSEERMEITERILPTP